MGCKLQITMSNSGPWTGASGKAQRSAASERAWNSNPLEITVLGLQPQDMDGSDAPRYRAAFIHALRDAAPHYSQATQLPLPLHLASKWKNMCYHFRRLKTNDGNVVMLKVL
jgi:hypothetical protein